MVGKRFSTDDCLPETLRNRKWLFTILIAYPRRGRSEVTLFVVLFHHLNCRRDEARRVNLVSTDFGQFSPPPEAPTPGSGCDSRWHKIGSAGLHLRSGTGSWQACCGLVASFLFEKTIKLVPSKTKESRRKKK